MISVSVSVDALEDSCHAEEAPMHLSMKVSTSKFIFGVVRGIKLRIFSYHCNWWSSLEIALSGGCGFVSLSDESIVVAWYLLFLVIVS